MSRLRAHAATVAVFALVSATAVAAPLHAQKPKPVQASGAKPVATASAKAAKVAPSPSLVGTWSGTATVPLGDSAIVVPVTYVFAETAGTMGGTATVPGQGTGPISNVVRSGDAVRFRVTVTQGLLEHDGKVGADGGMEGMVNMNNLPVARFKVAPKK